MLADPRLIVAEVVEPLDEFEVAVDGECGVLAHAVEWSEENAELHTVWQRHGGVLSCVVLSMW